MRIYLLALPLLAACSGLPLDPSQNPANSGPSDEAASWIPGRYLVRFAPGYDTMDAVSGDADLTAALDAVGATGVTPVAPDAGASFLRHTFAFESGQEPESILGHLRDTDQVVMAEPVIRVDALGAPNDPLFERQWHLREVGVPDVWDASTGSGTVVAVVDTGVAPGLDGFAHLLPGIDVVDGQEGPVDGHGHGTHVAGTIAQQTGNDYGGAGVAPDASILPVRVLNDSGSGTSADVAEGIVWAADNGAHIVNMSLGAWSSSQVIEDACAYAAERGVLLVAAAGNDGYSDFVSYPAAHETVIAVGATTLQGDRAYYSNRGAPVELAAPGGDTTADWDGDGYVDGVLQETTYNGETGFHYFMGTSMATPHVAGAAALVHAGGVTDAAELRARLTDTAIDLGDTGRDTSYGFGLVDPIAALGGLPDDPDDPDQPDDPDDPDQPDDPDDPDQPDDPDDPGDPACDAELCVVDLLPGDLEITEIMANPSVCTDHAGEWIEVANRTELTIDLLGLALLDAADTQGAIDASIVLQPDDHAVLARRTADTWCGAFTPDAHYGGRPALNNGGDHLALIADGVSIDETSWSGTEPGVSLELDALTGTWHLAETPIGDTDELGSPGAARTSGARSVDDLAEGELLVTEIMANPGYGADRDHEWIEVFNNTGWPVDLEGLEIVDEADRVGRVETSVVIAPLEVAVLARGDGSAWTYPFAPDAFYGGSPALNNDGDTVTIRGSQTLDEVPYAARDAESGVSIEWLGWFWIPAVTPIEDTGDRGTPGRLFF